MENLKKLFVVMVLITMAMQMSIARVSAAALYAPGDVVINEIAWAGSSESASHEWIELYNNSGSEIDLAGWYIEDDGSSKYMIKSGTIAPHGYFLIEDTEDTVANVSANAIASLSLANAGDSLLLKDAGGATIDTVNGNGGAWFAGGGTSKASMERIDPKVTLDNANNWASAIGSNNSKSPGGAEILGTPGSSNSNYGGAGANVSVSSGSVKNGGQITISVSIAQATDLYSYGFEINYDPAVLDFVSAKEDAFLKADSSATAFNSALQNGKEGTLVIGNARLINPPKGVDGSGKLFEVVFKGIGIDGDNSGLSFGGGSFLSDSANDVPAKFTSGTVNIGAPTVDKVANLKAGAGISRYALTLDWDGVSGATYVINKKGPTGNLIKIGESSENTFVDKQNIVANVEYSYQVVAVIAGVSSAPAEIVGKETRGLSGDLDRSDRVDGRDIEKLARSYGSTSGDEEYSSLKDTNYDGIIDGSDLISIGANFGSTY